MRVVYTLLQMLLWLCIFTIIGLLLATGFVTIYAAIPPLTAFIAVGKNMLQQLLSLSALASFGILLLLLKTRKRPQRIFLITGGLAIHVIFQWLIWTAIPSQDSSELILDDFYNLSPTTVVRNPDNSSFFFFQRVSANQLKDVVSNTLHTVPRLSLTPLMNYDPLHQLLSPTEGEDPTLEVRSTRRDELLSPLNNWVRDLLYLTSHLKYNLLNGSSAQFLFSILGISFFFMGMYLPFSLFYQSQAFTVLTTVLMFRLFTTLFAWLNAPSVREFVTQISSFPPSDIFFTSMAGLIGLIFFIVGVIITRKGEQL